MDYEKKYNEALERAKKVKHDIENIGCSMAPDMLEVIFPELAESEDERIRKELVAFFIEVRNREGNEGYWHDLKVADILSYLEKQKESLHISETCKENADSFTDEDEMIRRKMIEHFKSKTKDTWCNMPVKSIVSYLEKQKEEEGYEAIPVESTLEYKLGFKAGKESEKQKGRKPVLEVFGFKVGDAVRLKDGDGRKHIIKSFEEVEGVHGPNFYHVEFEDDSARDGIYPGEEYPNGYYTQMEKFEEEQKPVDYEAELKKCKDNPLYFYDKYVSIKLKPLMPEEKVKHPLYIEGFEAGKEVGALCEKVFKEQKPAEWSEEDEHRRKDAIYFLESAKKHYADTSEIEKTIVWLKSLPLNLKKKNEGVAKLCSNEWSEEDEDVLQNIIKEIEWERRNTTVDKDIRNHDRQLNFLKSLRPQPQGTYKQVIYTIFGMLKDKDFYEIQPSHRVSLLNDIRVKCKDAIECAPILDEPSWKPSEEQMEALESAVKLYKDTHFEIHHEKIVSLYEQLKKLM